jgi:UDP-glucose:(heptosyl)LPS alpha-1,3-glucosyltransferase
MKIALVRKAYSPYGGAERYLSQLIDRLCAQGHEVHAFARRWEANGRGLFFHRVPLIPSPSFMEALSFAYFSRGLLQESTFDIIHGFERTLYQDIYRAGDGCHREWLSRRRKIDPWLKRISHPLNPLHRSLLFLEKKLFLSPKLKRIIANSQKGKEEIIRHYGVPSEKVEVIYNGVDLDAFHPRNVALYRKALREELKINPDTFAILFLGSGFRRKGLDRFIASFPRIKKEIPKAYLIVAGKDWVNGYCNKARQLEIEKAVLFLGPTQRAKELYVASDLFALPTIYDPFNNACLEAMGTGIPVLTTLQNGAAGLIENEKSAFLLKDPKNHLEIVEKVLAFYHSPSKVSIGEKARKASLALDFDSKIRRLLLIYEEIKKE